MASILADAGVPMIFLTQPAMVLLLTPVILIEFLVSLKIILNTSKKKVWSGIIVANVLSTFIGWPIAWLLLVVTQIVSGGGQAYGLDSPLKVIYSITLQAPWLIPYESDLYWMVPSAFAVLLVPFFFVSVYAERLTLRFIWKQEPKANVIRFSWLSNFCSYSILLVVAAV